MDDVSFDSTRALLLTPHEERFESDARNPGPILVTEDEVRTIVVDPKEIFRGERLIVNADCRDPFMIMNVLVGGEPSPLFRASPIPATQFTEDNDMRLGLDVVTPNTWLKIVVKNISRRPCVFRAVIQGTAMQQTVT